MSKETDELIASDATATGFSASSFDSVMDGLANASRPSARVETAGRREDFPLIVHCHLRWNFVWQRPQQIFSRLAASHRILFIEDPEIAEGEPHLKIEEVQPNVVVLVPQIPQHLAVNSDKDAEIFFPLIQQALREHPLLAGRFEQPVQWFYSPMTAPGYLGRFGGPGIVYDCMDELASFRFAPPDIADRERFLMAKANVMFTGGYRLFDTKSKLHGNVHVYGCGVDVGHYGKARHEETEVPASIASLPRPVFGYFGVIDERLDYELVEALAKRFPEASVVMAGPFAKVDRNELPNLPNIHWLGQQSYSDLPALVKGFDVCLMPFAMNEATKYINPTKTLEYMAGGKPVVSTAVADVVRNFTPIVQVAYSPDEFVEAAERAWRTPDAKLIAEGIERAEASTWDAIVDCMRTNVQEAVFDGVATRSIPH